MSNRINLWLDDNRDPAVHSPDLVWVWVKTAQDAIAVLETDTVAHISLDHDLGDENEVGCGYDVATWIEESAFLGEQPRITWAIHSANPVGRKRMEAALTNAERYWNR